jgi:hypothetical protein
MSIINGLSITNILDIIKLLNNSDEIRKYFKIIYNKFCLETTMNAVNFATNKALIQTENALNKAIENIKIVKPLKTSKYPDFDKLWDNTINSLIITVKKALYFEAIAKTSILVTKKIILKENEESAKIMYSLAKLMRRTYTLKTLGALAENTLKKALIMRNMQNLHDALFMIVNIVNIASVITTEIAKQTQLSLFIDMINKLDEATVITNNAIINAMIIKNTNISIIKYIFTITFMRYFIFYKISHK